MIATSEDTAEKEQLGRLWAAKSDGRCLFVLATREDYPQQIGSAIQS